MHHQTNVKELFNRYKTDPDRELLQWERWVTIRKEETEKLGKATQRPPADLIMNLLEKVREDKELKTALEHAQIDKKPTVRKSLWEQPLRLTQECYNDPVYEIQRTAAEMGRPHIIEHIGVPEYIQVTEMGLTGVPERKPCTRLDTNYVKYKEKRTNELKEKLVKIDPFRPAMSNLIIKGSRPKIPPKKMPTLPTIIIDLPLAPSRETLSNVYAIRINNTVFFKDIPGHNLNHLRELQREPWHEHCTSWTFYFNVPVKRVGRSKLFLENLGTVTLRYCWKKLKRPIPFIPEEVYEQEFFFNKNEDVLSPGQSRELFINFVSNKPGIYNEIWEISICNINFFDTLTDKLIIELCADAIEDVERINKKVDKLISKINSKILYNLINNLINDAIDKSTATVPEIYPYKKLFLEAQIFCMKNPVCYYHQTEVSKMKDMFVEMQPGETWDLSITSWRETMIKQEFDDRMRYYENLKLSHSDLLKPWQEGDDLLKEKYRTVKLLLGQLADKFDNEYDRISELYGIIAAPTETSRVPSKSRTRSVESSTAMKTTINSTKRFMVSNLFYILIYEHVATTVELCAGVLSSLELNRWIEFDFCRW